MAQSMARIGFVIGHAIHKAARFDLVDMERVDMLSQFVNVSKFLLSHLRNWIWPTDIPAISMLASL